MSDYDNKKYNCESCFDLAQSALLPTFPHSSTSRFLLKTHTTHYLDIEPWAVTETGFHKDRSRVSESIFSLANEFMGIRGQFDEGYGGDTLVGSYFNGVYEEMDHIYPLRLSGFPARNHFMVNAVNWLATRLVLEGETLDLASSAVSEFVRRLDFRTGLMVRSFVWELSGGRRLRVKFSRLLSMLESRLGFQRIELEPLNFSGEIAVTLGLDFTPPHESAGRNFWKCPRKAFENGVAAILGETIGSGQKVLSSFRFVASEAPIRSTEIAKMGEDEKYIGVELTFSLAAGRKLTIDKAIANLVEKGRAVSADAAWEALLPKAAALLATSFDAEAARQAQYWEGIWKSFELTVDGDPANEQGTRYCIFQMTSTFHGVDPHLNIGAKGLTGEVYGGLAFWDTESYCLPFYLFTDPATARNLLLFRYNTLPQARERARQLDCEGARYPMTTIDGTEACGVWHHGDLEIHVPAAVAYGVWHYVHVTGDQKFLEDYGLEMLIEISRFYATHGGWSSKTGEFGLWGVMGADEFHMMIHNNAYTNTMAKKTFEWTLAGIDSVRKSNPARWEELAARIRVRGEEPGRWAEMARKMRLQRDPKTGLIEQHDGYFDLPHMDLKALPPEKTPVVAKFPYIKRSRYDWIKQPDVLLLPFFFSHDYTLEEKRVNFEYYEPRCVHESSLSPGVHSILATELGKAELAFEYVKYASRLDLDDYNRNTHQGLHMTSMAAAWMSLVYGFGGMRSDGERLSFWPTIPEEWNGYSFRIVYRGALLEVRADKDIVRFKVLEGPACAIDIYDRTQTVGAEEIAVPLRRREAAVSL